MNYNTFLDLLASKFRAIILAHYNVEEIPTEDFGWENSRYEGSFFRLAHVERYSDEKIHVLHVTTFPKQWSPEPIFGFDVICTDNKILGTYMDLSPTIRAYNFADGIDFHERKPIPKWATVFSDDFILLKPVDDHELERFCNWTLDVYQWYMSLLSRGTIVDTDDEQLVIHQQNHYCTVQASNPRTYNVLKAKIGAAKATQFMTEILFPTINT